MTKTGYNSSRIAAEKYRQILPDTVLWTTQHGMADPKISSDPTDDRIGKRMSASKIDKLRHDTCDYGVNRLSLILDGGTGDLFKFDTGAPFAGVQK